MNGFQDRGRGMSAQDSTSTSGKKIANSSEGKTTARRMITRFARSGAPFGIVPAMLRGPARRVVVVALALAGAVGLADGPPPAHAACGGVRHVAPSRDL